MEPQRFPEHGVWRAVATVCVLALAPAIGVGIARFAYSLLLPDMRGSLGWTYAAAGFMNTVNAAGYLIGASIAAAVMRRVGQHGAIIYGSLACVLALALSAMTGNFTVLCVARLAAGIGGAVAFVAGGVATVRIAQRHAGHAAFLVSLYYIGPGLGLLLSGIITPALLVELGPGSWWIGWSVLAVLTAIMCAALALARLETPASNIEETQVRAALRPMLIVVVSYCLFSVGTIAYMTFMIAWLAKVGAGATAQAVFWSLLGLGGICSPFLWSWAIAALSGGRAIAMLTALTFVAAAIGLSADLRIAQFLSAFMFGSALLAVVAATTAFVRQNYPPAAWPSGVGVMTVTFGLGQMIGPVLSGTISDWSGNLALAMQAATALLAIAAVLALFQRDLVALSSRHTKPVRGRSS
ncbi:MAG: YbfB/YjiJ family MFS transporter [Xanthobacteraceae bacterium]|nr:YbfB/YjiJ family MFS transporter [Xanthobacteraceae bacterium]